MSMMKRMLRPVSLMALVILALSSCDNPLIDEIEVRRLEAVSLAAVVLFTNNVTNIDETTAIVEGKIESDGGKLITERGVCWGTSPNPTMDDNHKSDDGLGLGSYSALMTGLSAGTFYYARSYATNGIATAYGAQVSFTTKPALPSVPTVSPVPFESGSGKLDVSWTSNNGASTYYDVYYDKSGTPPSSPNGPTDLTGTSCRLENLDDYDDYHVWVRAKNSSGNSLLSDPGTSMVGVKVEVITLNKSEATFLYESAESFTAMVFPETATRREVVWSSADETIATVSAGTVIARVATGQVTVRVEAADGQGASTLLSATIKPYAANTTGPAGGILFYDKGSYSDGWRYMEVSPNYVFDYNAGWCNSDWFELGVPGGNGTGIGFGKTNTDAIIDANGEGLYWALLCKDYTQGSYADWFMPSKDEIQELINVVSSISLSDSIVSSSQYSSDNRFCWIADGAWTPTRKYLSFGRDSYQTLPIRQF